MIHSHYPLNDETVRAIQQEYLRSDKPWFLGYSGGKDSSALLKLVFIALMNLRCKTKPVTVVYCDTGVDIPVVRSLVDTTLHNVASEASQLGLPLLVERVSPKLEDRYFVKVIGRGYPPPTNKFRWCTDRLRIDPVRRVVNSTSGREGVTLLGVRRSESVERDKTISRHETGEEHYFWHTGGSLIYAPIVNYSVSEVWDTLYFNAVPESLDAHALWELYQNAGADCPIVRDPRGTPCGKGRFGCWTCTVVRKDRAMRSLILEGYDELAPLLEFRDWLAEIRDLPEYRCNVRRNGGRGPGPLTLAARRQILERLLLAQERSGIPLISESEIDFIKALWAADEKSDSYTET